MQNNEGDTVTIIQKNSAQNNKVNAIGKMTTVPNGNKKNLDA